MSVFARPLSLVVEFVADRAPIATDDADTIGARIGSVWVWDDRRWHCLDATVGAALWWESAAADAVTALIAALTSANVVHTQQGTGAVTRTVQAKLREGWLSPEDFGAVGNGSTDDLAAWNLAVAASGVHGVPVRMTAGKTYRIAGPLYLTANSEIEGHTQSKFLCLGADFTATVKGAYSTGTAIYALSVANARLTNRVRIEFSAVPVDRWSVGVAFRGTTGGEISAEVWGCQSGAGIALDTAQDVEIVRPIVRDFFMDRATSGNVTGIIVDDARISGVSSRGVRIYDARIQRLICSTAFIASFGIQSDGITLMKGTTAEVYGFLITDVGEAFDVWGDDCIIQGGRIENVAVGVKVIHGARRCRIGNIAIRNVIMAGAIIAGTNTGGNITQGVVIHDCTVSGVGYLGVAYSSSLGWGEVAGFVFDGTTGLTWGVEDCGYENCVVQDSPNAVSLFSAIGAGTGRLRCFFHGCSSRNSAGTEYNVTNNGGVWVWGATNNVGTTRVGQSTRFWRLDQWGRIDSRYDDNGIHAVAEHMNAAITAAGHGHRISFRLGSGGGGQPTIRAGELRVLSTDTWAAAGNRSSRVDLWAALAGADVQMADFDPGQGVALLIGTAPGVGLLLRRLEVGAVDSAGTGYRTVRVPN